ncbi:DMT family transporter [Occultella aeris]|uniref:EamA-like transporter family protein n=1 Tax=Occultella aeris TaxID=2761496 RepID=A0A7M4DRY6_9MICO|nr:DMT family transporter [Occultella aeris]VZO40230.1 EamA-like transporter family protein [Occultella aeris]
MALTVGTPPLSAEGAHVPHPGATREPDPARLGPNRRLGILAIIVSATAMGAAGLFSRMATPSGAVIGESLTLGRMLVGAIGTFLVLALAGRLGQLRRVRLSPSVVLGGVFLGLSLATYLSATVLADLSRAVVLHYIGPVLATVLARVLLKERPGRVDVLSLGIGSIGMVLAAGLLTSGAGSSHPPEQETLGTILGVISGVCYAVALLCYRYRTDMPADVRSFWNFVFGALGTGAMVALTRPDLSGMTSQNWAWAGAFFLICGLLALGLLVVAGKHLRAAELSGLSYWEVVVAIGIGAAVFGEGISPVAAVGAALIALAMVPMLARRQPGAGPPAPEA